MKVMFAMLFIYLATLSEEEQNKFLILWEKHSKKLLVYVDAKMYGINTHKTSEDIVGDAYLLLMTHYQRYEELEEYQLKALLIKICNNLLINEAKRGNRICFTSTSQINDDGEENEMEIYDDSFVPEAIVISEDTITRIESIIQTLDIKYQDVLNMKLFIGLDDEDIAKTLNITKENVRKRYQRGREMIIRKMGRGK